METEFKYSTCEKKYTDTTAHNKDRRMQGGGHQLKQMRRVNNAYNI